MPSGPWSRPAARLEELWADGGATVNSWLMQFQADMLGVPVRVPEVEQTTALGAAYIAGVGANLWTIDQVARQRRGSPSVRARDEPGCRETLLHEWHRALDRARAWAEG